MTLKDELFGPKKEEVYEQLAIDLNGKFTRGDFTNPVKVDIPFKNWTITLDTKVIMEIINVSSGNPYGGNAEYTRVRAPFVKIGNFQFAITNTSTLDSFAKLLGAQAIIIGDENFDNLFMIQGNDELKVKHLFSNSIIRQLLIELVNINLTIRTEEGLFGSPLPENVNEIFFKSEDVIVEVNKLKLLTQLFSEILEQLTKIGVAKNDKPNIS